MLIYMYGALIRAGEKIRSARQTLETCMRLGAEIAIEAYADGVPEAVIARKLGVNRMTVRKWLGKR